MRMTIVMVALFSVTGCTAWKVQRVQDTVRGQSSCTSRLQVAELEDGWRVEGCDTSWFCGGANGPCEPRSCQAWEQVKYDKCMAHASRGGLDWGAQLAHAMMADSLIQECRIEHDRALQQCGVAVPKTDAPAGDGTSRM